MYMLRNAEVTYTLRIPTNPVLIHQNTCKTKCDTVLGLPDVSGLPVDKKCTLQPYSKRLENYTKAPDSCFMLQLLIRYQMFLRVGHMAALHCLRPHPHPMWNFGLASRVTTRKHELPGSTLQLVPRVTIVFESMLRTPLSCGITLRVKAPITDH